MESPDGAHLGVDAMSAMKAVIGGEEPTVRRDPVQMRAYLESFPVDAVPTDYEQAGAIAGHMVLITLLGDPSRASLSEYELYTSMKTDGFAELLEKLELSGFQWGWAVNAARYCVELDPLPNPAILTIGEDS